MADEQATPDSQANIPPKASISAAPTIRLAKPTIQLRRPGDPAPAAPAVKVAVPAAPAAPVAPTIKAEAPAAKSATTRIPLPDVGTDAAATIQIKPAAPATPAAADVQAAKSKTSRISLDSALGGVPSAAPVAGAPKTIRLKRPGEVSAPAAPAAAIPVATPLSATVASQTSRLPTSKLATAKLNEVAAAAAIEPAAEEAPLTRRKTIKVRRPGASGGPQISVNAAPDANNGAAAPAEGTDDSQPWTAPQGAYKPVVVADTAHWTFVVAACLSIIVTLATIVVLAAQAWGPNASLTEFSSWPAGPDIPLSGTYIK